MMTNTPTTGDAPTTAPADVELGPNAPPAPAGRPFGQLTIGTTTVTLLAADRNAYSRGYFLHDDVPAVEFGPNPDAATVANGVMAMVMLLGLAPPGTDR